MTAYQNAMTVLDIERRRMAVSVPGRWDATPARPARAGCPGRQLAGDNGYDTVAFGALQADDRRSTNATKYIGTSGWMSADAVSASCPWELTSAPNTRLAEKAERLAPRR